MAAPRRRINIELLLGISATFLSLAALIVSIFQTRIAREQQQASVWPYLQFDYMLTNSIDTDEFEFKLVNNGVGPALIKEVSVAYKGKPYRAHYTVFDEGLDSLINDTSAPSKESYRFPKPGLVIKAGEDVLLYRLAKHSKVVNRVNAIANDSSFHFKIRYADVYGNCWQLDRNQVTALGKCTD